MFLWLVILPIAAIVLFILVARMVRRLHPRAAEPTNYDFAIEQLVRLRQAGEISTEEFERAKGSILSRKASEPIDPSKRGFEVLQARPTIQPLEDRWSP